ncbi:MAG: CDP-glucose 4,6-dehydratase [Crenarchaeota archaeon]|nr:CDP-glucose 4,6-dehydratase [Thermoproteota archaeon]
MLDVFNQIYQGKTVIVTGHTGFKGSWLVLWLKKMGARVIGYSLSAPSNPSHYELLDIAHTSVLGDIRDEDKLQKTFAIYKPDIVFHLAAQPLVRYSYENPIETYDINVMGTLKVFDACNKCNVKAIVNVTSDKCYDNKEWIWGYRENDNMGGYDPYSSSKACAELLTSSYRNSFFNPKEFLKTHSTLIASCRAGNVIGGGDWGKDRLIPDVIRSVSVNKKVIIRSPDSTRPWQHVLEPLSGYLQIGQKLLESDLNFADCWNFGPNYLEYYTVRELIEVMQQYWKGIDCFFDYDPNQPHEARCLKLDCSKANFFLNWNSVWNFHQTLEKTVNWYKNYYENGIINTEEDLQSYISDAKRKKLRWAL